MSKPKREYPDHAKCSYCGEAHDPREECRNPEAEDVTNSFPVNPWRPA